MLSPLRFTLTLGVPRLPHPERRDASEPVEPVGRIMEGFSKEELPEGGFCSTRLSAPGRLWKSLDPVQCGERTWNLCVQRTAPFMDFIGSQRSWSRQGQRSWSRVSPSSHRSLPIVASPWPSSFFEAHSSHANASVQVLGPLEEGTPLTWVWVPGSEAGHTLGLLTLHGVG